MCVCDKRQNKNTEQEEAMIGCGIYNTHANVQTLFKYCCCYFIILSISKSPLFAVFLSVTYSEYLLYSIKLAFILI